MSRRYLISVTPLPSHILQVDFVSGGRLLLDTKPYLDKIRFRPFADTRVWNSAVINSIFVRLGDVELSHDEILAMAEQEHRHCLSKKGEEYDEIFKKTFVPCIGAGAMPEPCRP